MKKFIAIIMVLTMFISITACGGNSMPALNVGDTYSTDAVELTLLDVSYQPEYSSFGGSIIPEEGYTFVVIDFSMKNIGKNGLVRIPAANGGESPYPADLISIDYNDGYTFMVDKVTGENGQTYGDDCFAMPFDVTLSDLKPLDKGRNFEAAICVPNEVVENTDAPLLVKFNLIDSKNSLETAIFSVR